MRYYAYTACNFHFMEVHARTHEKLREQPELLVQAELMAADSIAKAVAEVDTLLAAAQQLMAANGVGHTVRYGAGPLLVPAEIVSPHCGSYLALLMKADRLFGLLEYERLRGYISNVDCDKEFARVDRLLKSVQRTALRLVTGMRRRLNGPVGETQSADGSRRSREIEQAQRAEAVGLDRRFVVGARGVGVGGAHRRHEVMPRRLEERSRLARLRHRNRELRQQVGIGWREPQPRQQAVQLGAFEFLAGVGSGDRDRSRVAHRRRAQRSVMRVSFGLVNIATTRQSLHMRSRRAASPANAG